MLQFRLQSVTSRHFYSTGSVWNELFWRGDLGNPIFKALFKFMIDGFRIIPQSSENEKDFQAKMPELAEVALFARDLSEYTARKKLTSLKFINFNSGGALIFGNNAKKTLKAFVGDKIRFASQGKALVVSSSDQDKIVLEFRLGMTGGFQLQRRTDHWSSHYFLHLNFEGSDVYFADPRRFSRVRPIKFNDASLGGYEKSKGLTMQDTKPLLPGCTRLPKITWLLKNGEWTGVGNYMANEALGRLNLNPFTPCTDESEGYRILDECKIIAIESFKKRGNSFSSGFSLLNGDPGAYQLDCKFYGKPNVPRLLFRGRPVFSFFKP